jgi:hypothetical protein
VDFVETTRITRTYDDKASGGWKRVFGLPQWIAAPQRAVGHQCLTSFVSTLQLEQMVTLSPEEIDVPCGLIDGALVTTQMMGKEG